MSLRSRGNKAFAKFLPSANKWYRVLIAGAGSFAYGVTQDGRAARAVGVDPVFNYWGG